MFYEDNLHRIRNSLGLFTVINLGAENGQNYSNNSRDVDELRSLANHIKYEFHVYSPKEAFSSRSRKRFTKNYLSEVRNYIVEDGRSFKCLITVVIARSEHARSGIPLYFFDNSASRMDLNFDDLTEPFLQNNFDYFVGKPKVFFVYAPEKVRAQEGRINTEYFGYSVTLPDADFFLCVSRPYEEAATISEVNRQSHFINRLCGIISNSNAGIEINQVMRTLQNETNEHSETRIRELGLEGQFVPAPLRFFTSLTTELIL